MAKEKKKSKGKELERDSNLKPKRIQKQERDERGDRAEKENDSSASRFRRKMDFGECSKKNKKKKYKKKKESSDEDDGDSWLRERDDSCGWSGQRTVFEGGEKSDPKYDTVNGIMRVEDKITHWKKLLRRCSAAEEPQLRSCLNFAKHELEVVKRNCYLKMPKGKGRGSDKGKKKFQ